MNKNPFSPQVPSTSHQPPLPPGPPPTRPPDYSAYWAQHHAQPQQQPGAPYAQAWAPPQPPRPPGEQALYANYGYANGYGQPAWQRQQPPQQQHYQPVAAPPAPPYNPYQPGYPQPYVGQPPPVLQQPYPIPPQPPQAPMFQPHIHPAPQMMQQQPPSQPRHLHHAPSQVLPPAKRPRFDGPMQQHNLNQGMHRNQSTPQPQNLPQPPPAGPSAYNNRGSGSSIPPQRGGVLLGRPLNRGGSRGSLSGPRGALSNRGGGGGRGGMYGQSPGRGAPPLRGQGSRGNFGGGNKDFHNRRGGGGGSFNNNVGGPYPTQPSFRGRTGNANNRAGRNDGSGSNLGARDGAMTSKKDEHKPIFTDFRLLGLEISAISWTWGTVPSAVKEEPIVDDQLSAQSPLDAPKAEETAPVEGDNPPSNDDAPSSIEETVIVKSESEVPDNVVAQPTPPALPTEPKSMTTPSRIRLYFHSPVTTADSDHINHSTIPLHTIPSDSRKGKRKKLEDDDGDLENGRAPPPPPQMSTDPSSVPGSVAPSVTESTGDDWLMASLTEGDKDTLTEIDEDEMVQPISDAGHGDDPPTDPVIPEDEHEELGFDVPVDVDVPDGAEDQIVPNVEAGHDCEDTDDHDGPKEDVIVEESAVPTSEKDLSEESKEPLNDPDDDASRETSSSFPSLPILDVPASVLVTDEPLQLDAVEVSASQVPDPPIQQSRRTRSLETLTSQPTLLNIDSQSDVGSSTFVYDAVYGDQDGASDVEQTQAADHLPEPPASSSSASAYGDAPSTSLTDAGNPKSTNTPAANRVSIAYASGTRRIVIDADVVESLKVYREQGRIEVLVNVESTDDGYKGILVEGAPDAGAVFQPLALTAEQTDTDATIPPMSQISPPSTFLLTAYLDTSRPLSETRWIRTGEIAEWLRGQSNKLTWPAAPTTDGWETKATVVDPDPPPTIWTVLDAWATNCNIGTESERQRFLKTHMTETDNILEILLRLVRGERATPFPFGVLSATSIAGPLLSALSHGSAHGQQQTHVSLAVLAIFRMTVEYAKKAIGDGGKAEAEQRVGEIIRHLPSHLVYKSLDGIFKEWRMDKKSSR